MSKKLIIVFGNDVVEGRRKMIGVLGILIDYMKHLNSVQEIENSLPMERVILNAEFHISAGVCKDIINVASVGGSHIELTDYNIENFVDACSWCISSCDGEQAKLASDLFGQLNKFSKYGGEY